MAESTNRDKTFFSWLFNSRMKMNVYLFDKYIRQWISKQKAFSSMISSKLNNPEDESDCLLIRNYHQNKYYCLLVVNYCIVYSFHIDPYLDSIAIYI